MSLISKITKLLALTLVLNLVCADQSFNEFVQAPSLDNSAGQGSEPAKKKSSGTGEILGILGLGAVGALVGGRIYAGNRMPLAPLPPRRGVIPNKNNNIFGGFSMLVDEYVPEEEAWL